ncbi:hypothetical protein HMPREF3016_04415 [Rothia sp. HMSC065D02]|nr:hypothetical protein HMPREF3016_04415 [Rothia sp. HMSC065D02]
MPRNQQDFLKTKPAPFIEYYPDFHIPIIGIRSCALLQKDLRIFRFKRTMAQLLYLYDHSKAARRVLISGHPGRLTYPKLG